MVGNLMSANIEQPKKCKGHGQSNKAKNEPQGLLTTNYIDKPHCGIPVNNTRHRNLASKYAENIPLGKPLRWARCNLKVLEMKISHSGFNVMKITVKWMKGGKWERRAEGFLSSLLDIFKNFTGT